ncbi:MAG: hypothetical protein Q8J80_09850 [Gallionella sp.]|nr:hypothetical protein [Gallionella sp.]
MAWISIFLMPNGDVETEARPGGGGDRLYMRRQKMKPPADGMIFGITFEEFKSLSYCVTNEDGEIIDKAVRNTEAVPPLAESEWPVWLIRRDKN